jgi:hypothetical protein
LKIEDVFGEYSLDVEEGKEIGSNWNAEHNIGKDCGHR